VEWLHAHVVQQIKKKDKEGWVVLGVVGAIVLVLLAGRE
jgi:hypothetical protein